MWDHNLTEGDWDPKMKQHVGSNDPRPSTPTMRLGKPMVWLLLLFCVCILVAMFMPQRKPWMAKSSDEWAQQILAESSASKSKRKAEFDRWMKDTGPGPSQALRDFKISSTDQKAKPKPKPQPQK